MESSWFSPCRHHEFSVQRSPGIMACWCGESTWISAGDIADACPCEPMKMDLDRKGSRFSSCCHHWTCSYSTPCGILPGMAGAQSALLCRASCSPLLAATSLCTLACLALQLPESPSGTEMLLTMVLAAVMIGPWVSLFKCIRCFSLKKKNSSDKRACMIKVRSYENQRWWAKTVS